MPAIKTDITEIVTGLGAMGFPTVDAGLAVRPAEMIGVSDDEWDRLDNAYDTGEFANEFTSAYENGRAFFNAAAGLRGRVPLRVEWKGPHQTPGYELIPADLRIDHVYLVSCKYQSKLLMNPSPWHLFERSLATRTEKFPESWYIHAAPEEYQDLYTAVRDIVPGGPLPTSVEDLVKADQLRIKNSLRDGWPESIYPLYKALCVEVSSKSAAIWESHLPTPRVREQMLWRILRLASAPYFVLGSQGGNYMRFRIFTPWDWRSEFELVSFDIDLIEAGQPRVEWSAKVSELSAGGVHLIEGHVEVRWSHGRFNGNPEAKIYLDTPHGEIPGYAPLV